MAIMLVFLGVVTLFVVYEIVLYTSAVRAYQDKKYHARWYCDQCSQGKFIEEAGDYGFNCYDACSMAHDSATFSEVGWRAVVDGTHLCLFWDCSTIGWFKLVFCIALLVYGLRYSAFVLTSHDPEKTSPLCLPCALMFWVLEQLVGVVQSLFATMQRVDETPKYKQH